MSVTYASFHRARLIEKDWRILARLRARIGAAGGDPYLADLLDRKLKFARLLPVQELSPTVVTMNSRVLFRVENVPQPARVIVAGDAHGVVGATIPVTTAWGLTLLGLSIGQHATVERRDGERQTLFVDAVLYQPENAPGSMTRSPNKRAASSASDCPAAVIIRPARFVEREQALRSHGVS